ncbi:MAG: methionyl-tRNA formyltransferase [Gammaproteobacteria bacterium]|nr:methionyl-tRNA formyltransferase [Gammaproteobacteria bacterium]
MLKIIYAGTPEFAVPALEALIGSRHRVIAAYTQPDRPAGRGRALQQSPVKTCALEHDIPVYQPESFKQKDDVQQLFDLQADLMVVAAYGLILPKAVLDTPKYGCFNIHASLLPRWRGAAPIQRAILAGDAETGITIMQMAEGLDTGDMLLKQSIPIDSDWNSGELHDRLKDLGAELLLRTLENLIDGTLEPEVQNDAQTTYAAKLSKAEAAIDWRKTAESIQREIRAYSPWPVSFTTLDGKPVRVWRASIAYTVDDSAPMGRIVNHDKEGIYVKCGSGILQITELQFAGKNKSNPGQILNARNLTGLVFS